MKKVFPPAMVAHLWANRSQDQARNAGESFYFTGPTIYSYRDSYPIAHHLKNGPIVWRDDCYSNTTARHKSHVYCAMSSSQWDSAIHVPSLDSETLRNLTSWGTKHIEKGDCKIIEVLQSKVIDLIHTMTKMRSETRMKGTLEHARSYETSGLRLISWIKGQNKKAKIKAWALPALPAVVPTDKAARAAMITQYVSAQAMADYREALTAHKAIMRDINDTLSNPDIHLTHSADQNLHGRLTTAGHKLKTAAQEYKIARGGAFPGLIKLQKDFAAIEAPIVARVAESKRIQAVRELKYSARLYFKLKHAKKPIYADSRAISKINECISEAGNDGANYQWLADKMRAIKEFSDAEKYFAESPDNCETAKSYLPEWPNDAMRFYTQAREAYKTCLTCAPFVVMQARKGVNIGALLADVMQAIEPLKAAIVAREKEKLTAWLDGSSNAAPSYEAGTFARIMGETVETSRGAIVPLEHACRLARIARRVIAHGGKSWPDGEGPQIGHFRVNSIAADGTTVIGCHEFDASEAHRMLALLDDCPTCKGMAADSVV